MALGR